MVNHLQLFLHVEQRDHIKFKYTTSQNNDTDLACYNFTVRQLILIIFG